MSFKKIALGGLSIGLFILLIKWIVTAFSLKGTDLFGSLIAIVIVSALLLWIGSKFHKAK